MDQVALAAGVTKPLLYQHFESKHALYEEIVTAAATTLLDELAVAASPDVSPREKVERGFDAYFTAVLGDDASFRLLLVESDRRGHRAAPRLDRARPDRVRRPAHRRGPRARPPQAPRGRGRRAPRSPRPSSGSTSTAPRRTPPRGPRPRTGSPRGARSSSGAGCAASGGAELPRAPATRSAVRSSIDSMPDREPHEVRGDLEGGAVDGLVRHLLRDARSATRRRRATRRA